MADLQFLRRAVKTGRTSSCRGPPQQILTERQTRSELFLASARGNVELKTGRHLKPGARWWTEDPDLASRSLAGSGPLSPPIWCIEPLYLATSPLSPRLAQATAGIFPWQPELQVDGQPRRRGHPESPRNGAH